MIVSQMAMGRPNDGRISVLTLGRRVGTSFGGAERVAYDFAMRLDSKRFASHVCVTQVPPSEHRAANEADLAALEAAGVEVLRPGLSKAPWLRLYGRLRSGGIDVLHAHMPRASVPGSILARLAGTPVTVSHEHTWSFEGRPLRRFLDRNVVARNSDLMLAVSECDRQRMISVERIPAERIRVLPNGIPHVAEDGPDIRTSLGAPPGTALIGAVGRLYAQKGYEELIHAIARLEQRLDRPFRCVVVGRGPERETLQTMIDELGLAERVELLGRREDIDDIVRSLDVAVLPSRYEGSPLTIIEYMAAAAPIVASAVGGVPELIEDRVHGLLVPPEDPERLADGIQTLLDDRELAARLGRSARERQLARFDLDVVVARLEELYVELYERSGAARAQRVRARV